MKKLLPLHNIHLQLGAKMIEFGDYLMPLDYSGIMNEHLAVRNCAGIFDISHMGEFVVKGKNSILFLQKVTTNDIEALYPGKAQYSCFTNENGGVIDDIIIYCLKEKEYLIIVNSANRKKDYEWLMKNLIEEVELKDESDNYALFAIQGPESIKIVRRIFGENIHYKPFLFEILNFDNIENVLISNTGYTGSIGFEILVDVRYAEKLWNIIYEHGKEFNLIPVGLGARDTLRIEAGLCLYGHELNENITPLEAGLNWIVKFDAKDFIGKERLLELKNRGISKKLIGFEFKEKIIPRQSYEILSINEQQVGEVTSGTYTPYLQKSIGMGYVKSEYSDYNNDILVNIRGKLIKAKIVKLPFYKAIRNVI